MHTDVQIAALGKETVPLDYVLPGAADFILKAVNATFTDTGAVVDWLPCVTLISDSGAVIARAVDQNVSVAAGSDAEVSWFPGVKIAPSGARFVAPTTGLSADTQVAQTITSGVSTALSFTQFTYGPGILQAFVNPAFAGWTTLVWANPAVVVATLIVDWPAAAYDRYIEFAVVPPSSSNFTESPRVRGSLSPDADRLTLTAVLLGGPADPTTLACNVFQASGVNRNVTAQLQVDAIPRTVL